MKKEVLGVMVFPYPDKLTIKIDRLSTDTLNGIESHFYRYSYLSDHIFVVLDRFMAMNRFLQVKLLIIHRKNLLRKSLGG